MSIRMFGMLAETPIHPGSGQDAGLVDLPVAREKATDYPVIVGSSLKGALKDAMRDAGLEGLEAIFGRQDDAGTLIVGDGRLLLLPVRSLQGAYRWATCPQLLNRFSRDAVRTGLDSIPQITPVTDGKCLSNLPQGKPLYLEEREFESLAAVDSELINRLSPLMPAASQFLPERLVVLSDNDFAWFARYGLCINARNQLDVATKTSKNLWYEETLPPDSVFYFLLADRETSGGAVEAISKQFWDYGYLQVGGNQTVGQGVFAITPIVASIGQEVSA